MKNNHLVGYGIGAVLLAIVLQYTWQWLVGGLAVLGAIYVLNEINRNHRN